MTVRELIDELEMYDEDTEVAIKPSNSMYVESVNNTIETEVRGFWDKDYDAVVICCDEQIGTC